jgi:hypothetical protein
MTYAVLNSSIPTGGFGRPLTSSEIRALRREGRFSVSNRAIVVQAGADYRGYLYEPRDGGFSGGSVVLETRGEG